MRRSRKIWLGGVALMAVALAGLWSARRPIAHDAIRRALVARGVEAHYLVREIGFRSQRLENIVIGDPARPDLTAQWAEVDLAPSWSGVTVTAVRAHGVRLRGRLVGSTVSWGAVDRLLPKSDGSPLRLPDIDIALDDAAIALTTELGPVGAALTGRGNLQDGFRGRIVAVSPVLQRPGCAVHRVKGDVAVTISARAPALSGPITAAFADCAGLRAATLRVDAQARATEAFERWSGMATATAPAARYGAMRLAGLSFDGRYGGQTPEVTGTANVAHLFFPAPDPGKALANTPVGPIAERLFAALRRAGAGTAVTADLTASADAARVTRAVAMLPGGGRLSLGEGEGIGIAGGKPFADVRVTLADPGLPAVDGRIRRAPDGAFRGQLDVAPYAAGSSRVALTPVAITVAPDGRIAVDTTARIDGPIGNGRVEGLTMPIAFRRTAGGSMTLGQGCTPVAFTRIAVSGTVFGRNALNLCPISGASLVAFGGGRLAGGARTSTLRLAGKLDGQPLSIAAATLSAGADGRVAAQTIAIRTGPPDARTRLDLARLDGSLDAGGRFTGLAGQIGKVPLIAADGSGNWRFAKGALTVTGTGGVRDAADPARFHPMLADAVQLRLADNRITATATLREPQTNKAISGVTLAHDLNSGVGEAQLTVDGLVFGKRLQPDMLTDSTKGIVQLVEGQIDGKGLIRWDRQGVTSSGRFTTDGLDFAAAFGTVAGLSGTIAFDDLLALSTPPGQRVAIKSINPGVEVNDGVIAFRLRPNQLVEIEEGRWPFAGGELRLLPAALDFGESRPRTMTFRLTALDAGKFIERLQLENIAATGTFDGDLPIVFDATGGRISGGRIVARGAGTLAYVGDVSNAQSGAMTRLAFDALKSLHYNNLAIELDGSLDGEIVSRVLFAGTNQAPVAPTGIARSFTGLPFKFNVVVRAPFRGLVDTARRFQDPASAIKDADRVVKP